MKAKLLLWKIATVTVFMLNIFEFHITKAKTLTVHPLRPSEIYRVLRLTGNENALPDGRVVTQGLTALVSEIGGTGNGTTSQEICFNSRSARNLRQAEEVAAAYIRLDTKRDNGNVRYSETPRRLRRKRRNKSGHIKRNHNRDLLAESKIILTTIPTATVPTYTSLGIISTSTTVTNPQSTFTEYKPNTLTMIFTDPNKINCFVVT